MPALVLPVCGTAGINHFQKISGRFSALLFTISLLLWLSSTAPRETSEEVPAIIASLIGGLGVVFGVRHMTITHHDVVVAPFGGILLCMDPLAFFLGDGGNMIKPSK